MIKQLKPLVGPLIGLLAINAVFFLLSSTYRQPEAIRDILEQSAVLLIMATGTTIILISGQLDLSVGSILALVSVVTGSMLLSGMPVWLSVLGGLAAGTLCGLINGLVVVGTGVPGDGKGRVPLSPQAATRVTTTSTALRRAVQVRRCFKLRISFSPGSVIGYR